MTDKHAAAQRVADELFKTEQQLDLALSQAARLVAEMAGSRQEFGVAMKVGAPALTKFSSVVETLAAAREVLAAGHDEIAVVQRAIGVRPNLFGGGEKGPNQDSIPTLHRVA